MRKLIGAVSVAQAFLSYFVGRFLDRLIAGPSREIVQPNMVIVVDRPGKEWDIIVYYLVVAIAVLVLSWYFQIKAIKGTGQSETGVKATCFRVLIGLLIFIVITALALSLSKRFLVAEVSSIMDVSGHLSDRRLKGYLFVRPVNSSIAGSRSLFPLCLIRAASGTQAYFLVDQVVSNLKSLQ